MRIRIKRKKVIKEAAISPEEYLDFDDPQIQLEIGDWGIEIDAGDIGSLSAFPISCNPGGVAG